MPSDYEIHASPLSNGLRVVVAPDHGTPAVAVNLWVGVGSRHERAGRTGFAHLFEHLMFQGSRSVRSGEHFEALLAVGGQLNATTWFDRTNYFETVPAGALDLALWLEADRHGFLLEAVTQDNLDNQRDVVKEEKRQRYDNAPYGLLMPDLYAALFPVGHPYHHPTIGSMEDLDAATLADVHAFFTTWYGPNNTVLTLAGDVDPDAAFTAVERYFGELPASATGGDARPPVLDPLIEPTRFVRTADVPHDRVVLAFRLPADRHPDVLPAALALDIAGGLASSRLVRSLVRESQQALSVHSAAWGLVGGSIGFLTLDVAPGSDTAAVEAHAQAALADLGERGPTGDELAAATAQAERAWLAHLAGLDGRADLISASTLLHDDPQFINTHLDEILTVTGEQVQRAAARYLQPAHCATVVHTREEVSA